VATAGDLNNDGIADVILGALNGNNDAGQSYVIFGMGSPVPQASSSATPTPTPTSSLSFGASPSNTFIPSHNNSPGDNHELGVGAIAGIAVGAAAGVALLSGGVAWYGKTHGWWCAGEHSDGYVGVDGRVN
jgi:hypothetical protein